MPQWSRQASKATRERLRTERSYCHPLIHSFVSPPSTIHPRHVNHEKATTGLPIIYHSLTYYCLYCTAVVPDTRSNLLAASPSFLILAWGISSNQNYSATFTRTASKSFPSSILIPSFTDAHTLLPHRQLPHPRPPRILHTPALAAYSAG